METVTESRRVRQRRQLVDELCAEARRQLAAGGPAAVSWRGLARAVGMSPAALYTYFSGLDELFTELILRIFGELAAATERAVAAFDDASAGDRILAGPLAYRRWALAHRAEFNLVFTDQLPGYAAEPGGATVEGQTAIFRPMARAIAEALGIDPGPDPTSRPPEEVERFVGLWGLFHGLVTLEVNHHLDWVDSAAVFERRLRWAIDAAGLPPAEPDLVARFEAWAPRSATE